MNTLEDFRSQIVDLGEKAAQAVYKNHDQPFYLHCRNYYRKIRVLLPESEKSQADKLFDEAYKTEASYYIGK